VELFEQRTEPLHPSLGRLGPDLLADDFDATEARRRLRSSERATVAIGEALVDQRALAGIGNIWKSETLFAERVSPFASVETLDDATLDRLVATARRFLTRSAAQVPGRQPMAAYRRAGRPCPRCGSIIRSQSQGAELPRTTYWCPGCQEGAR
jgi:endonuclease-8